MKRLIKIINDEPNTHFAPPINPYHLYEETLFDDNVAKNLKDIILSKEKLIINSYKDDYNKLNKNNGWIDGSTGLGKTSLTSRSPFYNLLKWKEFVFLKDNINNVHKNFCKSLNIEPTSVYIQAWANVMRDNEKINTHHHQTNSNTYLGGHICVLTNNTNTNYVNPFTKEEYSSKNEIGKITMFPNWVDHYTDQVKNDLRITIAFDMMTEKGFNEDVSNDTKNHWIKL